eukprot:4135785-Amphidinium_carterae.3
MAWQGKQLASLLSFLAALNAAGQGRPGNWNRRIRSTSQTQDKPRKDFAGMSWNCTVCGFYNFGYRKTCFQCKQDHGNAKPNVPCPPGKWYLNEHVSLCTWIPSPRRVQRHCYHWLPARSFHHSHNRKETWDPWAENWDCYECGLPASDEHWFHKCLPCARKLSRQHARIPVCFGSQCLDLRAHGTHSDTSRGILICLEPWCTGATTDFLSSGGLPFTG